MNSETNQIQNTQSNNNTQKNKKTMLYEIFIIVSIFIIVFLFPFVFNMMSKFPSAYTGNESTSSTITIEIANSISIYVWPILIAYLILFIVLVKKKINNRKTYYPLFSATTLFILLNIGIIYYGLGIIWLLLLLFYPLIGLIMIVSSLGKKIDDNITINKKKIIKTTIILFVVVLIVLILKCVNIGDKIANIIFVNEAPQTLEEEKEQQVVNEFNDLLDSTYISVDELSFVSESNTIQRISLLIENDNMPNSEVDFYSDLIESYNNIKDELFKYNYYSQIIDFKFTNKNPFVIEPTGSYQDGGYIRDLLDQYLIYLNPSPIKIIK